MKAKCIENKLRNTNFILDNEYNLSNIAIGCEWGNMWIHFEDFDKPNSFAIGSEFDFAMCEFVILKGNKLNGN